MGRTDLVVVLDEAGTFDLPVPDVTDEVIFPEPSEELRAAIDELAPAC